VQSEIEKIDKETQIHNNPIYEINGFLHSRRREFNSKIMIRHNCINLSYNMSRIKKYKVNDMIAHREESLSIEKKKKVKVYSNTSNPSTSNLPHFLQSNLTLSNKYNEKSTDINTIYEKINNLKILKKKLCEEVKNKNEDIFHYLDF